jgi:hypothetical protein
MFQQNGSARHSKSVIPIRELLMKITRSFSSSPVLCATASLVLVFAGCDSMQPSSSGTGGDSASSTGAPSSSIEAYRRTLPPVPDSLKPLAAELEQLAKQEARPENALPTVPLPGQLPYKMTADGKMVAVNLTYTPVSDEFLKKLVSVPGLEEVSLTGTKVTDAGLEVLGAIPTLKSVRIWQTQVTEAGAQKFREAHPQCEVRGPDPSK